MHKKMGRFHSHPAEECLKSKNSTTKLTTPPVPGAGQVGCREPNPYGPDPLNKGGSRKGSTNQGGSY